MYADLLTGVGLVTNQAIWFHRRGYGGSAPADTLELATLAQDWLLSAAMPDVVLPDTEYVASAALFPQAIKPMIARAEAGDAVGQRQTSLRESELPKNLWNSTCPEAGRPWRRTPQRPRLHARSASGLWGMLSL